MILGPDSRLRRIPSALDRKTAFFIEGIRVSIEMIDLTHQRLQQALITITSMSDSGPQLPQGHFTSIITDAWVIIDCIHRLHRLITYMPHVKRKMRNPAFRNFLINGQKANEFRNTVQHLDQNINDKSAIAEWSVWGLLSWAVPYPDQGILKSCTFMAGMMEEVSRPLLNPMGKPIRLPVGLITLFQQNLSISISDLINDVERLAQELERSATAAFDADPRLARTYASDVVITMTFATPEREQSSSAG
jgi:hypothetical protein